MRKLVDIAKAGELIITRLSRASWFRLEAGEKNHSF
jgi:hypothetical protein